MFKTANVRFFSYHETKLINIYYLIVNLQTKKQYHA